MNFNQILIRLGVDASAVTSGLGKVGAGVKAWFAGLQHDISHHFGRMLTAGFAVVGAERLFEGISEKILAIKRSQEELGASSNFVQGAMLAVQKMGLEYEAISRPLIKFSTLLGQAKDGSLDARMKLIDMGVATKNTNFGTLTLAGSLQKLQDRYKTLNAEQRNSLLAQAGMGGKSAGVAGALLSGENVSNFERGGFFTKMSEETINSWQESKAAYSTFSSSVLATAANTWTALQRYNLVAIGARAFGDIFNGASKSGLSWKQVLFGIDAHKNELETERESVEFEEKKTALLAEQNSLLEKQKELQATISDRNKLGLSELANEGRKLGGGPRKKNYVLTARMREAMKIQDLEDQSTLAWERGDDAAADKFRDQALAERAANPWLKRADQNPNAAVEVQLEGVNAKLAPVQRMAETFNKDAAHPAGHH